MLIPGIYFSYVNSDNAVGFGADIVMGAVPLYEVIKEPETGRDMMEKVDWKQASKWYITFTVNFITLSLCLSFDLTIDRRKHVA